MGPMSVGERLNYKSNTIKFRKTKIIRALKNEKCNYIVVEGPPGTGKSHTISSIAFDYILRKINIDPFDTKEALDVVENKIDKTLDKVRGEQTFKIQFYVWAKWETPIARFFPGHRWKILEIFIGHRKMTSKM